MTSAGPSRSTTHLRVPRTDGSTLQIPPLDQATLWWESNCRAIRAWPDPDIQGLSLSALRRAARRHLLGAAQNYTRQYVDLPERLGFERIDDSAAGPCESAANPDQTSIIMSGHQPAMFHPGVWFKNFVLSGLARRVGAVPINLVVDTDAIRHSVLQVPVQNQNQVQVQTVEFDRPGPELPYEERAIWDSALFRSFGARAAAYLEPWISDPLIKAWWPQVVERGQSHGRLGLALAQARHRLELSWGGGALEVPQSQLCDHETFRQFTAHLLAHLPRFWQVHNAALAEFRRTNKIRSRRHPVPDLEAQADWLEVPLWIWTTDQPARRRLFARRVKHEIEVTDRAHFTHRLWLPVDSEATTAVSQMADWAARGIKLRSRALLTTWWARLVLCDLFLHGVGGSKYDQLTDIIWSRFLGLEPTRYLTLSATLLLPLPRPDNPDLALRETTQRLRQLEFQPERTCRDWFRPGAVAACQTLGDGPAALSAAQRQAIAALLATKGRWVATRPGKYFAGQRSREIVRMNQLLQPWIAAQRQQLQLHYDKLLENLSAYRVLASREYAFPLFPEKVLTGFMLEFLLDRPYATH